MNLDHKEQRLKKLLEDSIREGKIGTAIAITGSWGVGKTFFWNKFRDNYDSKKKYVYVSLFGLESLSDLKTHIYSNIENNHSALEIPRWIRGLPSILKDTRISQFGINASAKVFDSLMFNQVKDAIICFDDFERMSNKLDIKDVMGLANQLKLEKNCQIILILDEDKAEGRNKKKYAEYKEKLIDETIKITSVEPLIRSKAKEADIDQPLVDLMVKFADELDIHNFRFFQKVIKLYKQFREQLPEEVAYSTTEIILIRILQGYFIEDFGTIYEVSWNDFTLKNAVRRRIDKGKEKDEKDIFLCLEKVSSRLIYSEDEWFIHFKQWVNQPDYTDYEVLRALAKSELISEENNKLTEKFHQTTKKFWSLQADENFPTELYEITKKVIGLDSLGNISFAIKLLEMLGHQEKVDNLENLTIEWINEKIITDCRRFSQAESWGEIRDNFKNYIDNFDFNLATLPALIDAVFKKYINGAWSNEDEVSVEKANKKQWEDLLFIQIPQDERFNDINSSYIVTKILERPTASKFELSFRKMIVEIYEEKGKESEFYKNYMDYLISRLDE